MDVILYNPISRNGKSHRLVLRLARRLKKQGRNVTIKSLLEISNISEYLEGIDKKARFIIVGGDGTLNHLANHIRDYDIKQEVYLYRGGTGNDFARSLKSRKRLVSIKEYLYNLPRAMFNDEEQSFINGVGIGLDSHVCYLTTQEAINKKKSNYLKLLLRAFKDFKPGKSIVTVDGKVVKSDKTWLVAVMHSPYFGGGVKIAPKASRDKDELEVVIVSRLSRLSLFFLFPLIYLGWHGLVKGRVQILTGTNINIKYESDTYLQIDGESFSNVKDITIKSGNLI